MPNIQFALIYEYKPNLQVVLITVLLLFNVQMTFKAIHYNRLALIKFRQ